MVEVSFITMKRRGGLDILGDITNLDKDKDIKYCRPRFALVDRFGTVLYRGSINVIGPIYAGLSLPFRKQGFLTVWDVEIRKEFSKAVLLSAEVEYMDGTTKTFTRKELEEAKEKANASESGGCYVATAVYGSYDCPQVWTLRRYRDYKLDSTWYGRLFIRLYYATSPTLVKWFGHTSWFKKMWKGKLDRMVERLREEGYEDTPYNDKY